MEVFVVRAIPLALQVCRVFSDVYELLIQAVVVIAERSKSLPYEYLNWSRLSS